MKVEKTVYWKEAWMVTPMAYVSAEMKGCGMVEQQVQMMVEPMEKMMVVWSVLHLGMERDGGTALQKDFLMDV